MLNLTQEEARARIRKLSPYRTVSGTERKQLELVFALMEPVYQFNDQRSWTDVYHLDDQIFYVSSGCGDEVEIVERLPDVD